MKKFLSLLLAALMILGCASFAFAEEKQTVTIWTSGSKNVGDLFTALCEAYNARPESKFTATTQFILSGTGDEGLSSRIASAYLTNQTNTSFDLIADNTSSFQGYVDEAQSEDLFMELDTSKIAGYENLTVTPAHSGGRAAPYLGRARRVDRGASGPLCVQRAGYRRRRQLLRAVRGLSLH